MGIAAKSDLKALKFTTIETKGSRTVSTKQGSDCPAFIF